MDRWAKALRRRWKIREPAGDVWARITVGMAVAVAALAMAACQPVPPVAAAVQAPEVEVVETAPAVEEAAPAASTAEAVQEVATDAEASANPEPDEALVEQGMAVYRAQYCGVCHTLAAAGTKGTFGPPHDGMGSTAAQRVMEPGYTGAATTAAGYLYESLVKPEAYFVESYISSSHRMPPYTHLSEEELQALVAFLLAQD